MRLVRFSHHFNTMLGSVQMEAEISESGEYIGSRWYGSESEMKYKNDDSVRRSYYFQAAGSLNKSYSTSEPVDPWNALTQACNSFRQKLGHEQAAPIEKELWSVYKKHLDTINRTK